MVFRTKIAVTLDHQTVPQQIPKLFLFLGWKNDAMATSSGMLKTLVMVLM